MIDGNNMEDEDGFSDDGENDAELDHLWKKKEKVELPSEFWQIRKLLKYAKNANQTTTVLALCNLRDYDLTQDINQRAFLEEGGTELMLNILETKEQRPKVAALKILKILTKISKFRRMIVEMEGIPSFVDTLDDSFCEVKSLSAECLADLMKTQGACDLLIEYGGAERLVKLIDLKLQTSMQLALGQQISGMAEVVEVVRCGAMALAAISKNRESRIRIFHAGVVTLAAHLMRIPADSKVLIPTVDILQECAAEEYFREAILKEEIILQLIDNVRTDACQTLTTLCANAIMKCAENPETKHILRKNDGLKPLVAAMSKCKPNDVTDRKALRALTGALWKSCSKDEHNVAELQKFYTVDALVNILLDETDDNVLWNVIGAMAECVNNQQQREIISKRKSVPLLVKLLAKTNQILLINVTQLLQSCCFHSDNMRKIEKEDGIRHLWSLLRNTNPEVQANAAEAIHACLDQAPNVTEQVRNFVGGLELLVDLLSSPYPSVQSSVCGVIAVVAKNMDNLAVITDNGAVAQLAKLASNGKNNKKLKRYIAEAIANCCALETNAAAFGQENAVIPLVGYLKSSDEAVQKMAVKALALLSLHPPNCHVMRQNGAVKMLLVLIGSKVQIIQEDAATALGNIRLASTTV